MALKGFQRPYFDQWHQRKRQCRKTVNRFRNTDVIGKNHRFIAIIALNCNFDHLTASLVVKPGLKLKTKITSTINMQLVFTSHKIQIAMITIVIGLLTIN